jgi:hypothetical protein
VSAVVDRVHVIDIEAKLPERSRVMRSPKSKGEARPYDGYCDISLATSAALTCREADRDGPAAHPACQNPFNRGRFFGRYGNYL